MSNEELDSDVAIEQCIEIARLIDEDVPEWAWDKASGFFEDVRESVGKVEETITEAEVVTQKQQTALDNWEEGVRKWIKD